jgi:hypothetical protein
MDVDTSNLTPAKRKKLEDQQKQHLSIQHEIHNMDETKLIQYMNSFKEAKETLANCKKNMAEAKACIAHLENLFIMYMQHVNQASIETSNVKMDLEFPNPNIGPPKAPTPTAKTLTAFLKTNIPEQQFLALWKGYEDSLSANQDKTPNEPPSPKVVIHIRDNSWREVK